jgi:hypothetical protein
MKILTNIPKVESRVAFKPNQPYKKELTPAQFNKLSSVVVLSAILIEYMESLEDETDLKFDLNLKKQAFLYKKEIEKFTKKVFKNTSKEAMSDYELRNKVVYNVICGLDKGTIVWETEKDGLIKIKERNA